MDAARGGLGEDGPAVGHHEGLVTLEGRVEVGHDPDEPAAGRAVGLEGGRRVLLVAGAERAGAVERVGLPGGAGHERVGPLRAAGAHDDPTARQRIEAQLVHRCTLSGRRPDRRQRAYLHGLPSTSTVQVPLAKSAPGSRGRHPRSTDIGEHVGHAPPAGRRRLRRRAAAPRGVRGGGARHAWPTAAATASRLRRLWASPAPLPEPLRRYFRPGFNWAGRFVYGIPVFGFALIAMSHGCLCARRRLGAGGPGALRRRRAARRGGAVAGGEPAPGCRRGARTGDRPAPRCRADGPGRHDRGPGGRRARSSSSLPGWSSWWRNPDAQRATPAGVALCLSGRPTWLPNRHAGSVAWSMAAQQMVAMIFPHPSCPGLPGVPRLDRDDDQVLDVAGFRSSPTG